MAQISQMTTSRSKRRGSCRTAPTDRPTDRPLPRFRLRRICELCVICGQNPSLAEREHKARESGKKFAAIQRLLPAVVQKTAQFIRTLRNGIALGLRWLAAQEPLRASMKAYL